MLCQGTGGEGGRACGGQTRQARGLPGGGGTLLFPGRAAAASPQTSPRPSGNTNAVTLRAKTPQLAAWRTPSWEPGRLPLPFPAATPDEPPADTAAPSGDAPPKGRQLPAGPPRHTGTPQPASGRRGAATASRRPPEERPPPAAPGAPSRLRLMRRSGGGRRAAAGPAGMRGRGAGWERGGARLFLLLLLC